MSWIQQLYATYEANANRPMMASDAKPLLPVSHALQQAHIEVVLNFAGEFLRAAVIEPTYTIIPVTETSSVRTTNDAPHALNDKVQYVAGDYKTFGGRKRPYFESFQKQLKEWCLQNPHPMSKAVLTYVNKQSVIADLIKASVVHVNQENVLMRGWSQSAAIPQIFRILTKKEDGIQDQGDAFIRWRVESQGNPLSGTWEDQGLIQSWIDFVTAGSTAKGYCQITGISRLLARKHPAKLRNGKDGAKLISSNDESGYTFRGRFLEAEQAVAIGSEVTQKAHSALRWLIGRKQAHHNGTQVIVTWAVSGKDVPDPLASSDALFVDQPSVTRNGQNLVSDDVGQDFARRLSMMIAGYKADLGPADQIITMGLDSATPGRMAITFYRELKGSDFLHRIATWHHDFAWPQQFSWEISFVGAPSPVDIAKAVFGDMADDKIRRGTIERLLPCIIDGRTLPCDLIEAVVHRVARRVGMISEERRIGKRQIKYEVEWEKSLGIACSLFRGFHKERKYSMALDTKRRTRDYLYGRLLAIAETLEKRALYIADETRDTTASRLMQRFCDHPYTTWLNIEKGLQPYRSRLQAKNAGFLHWISSVLDDVHDLFEVDDYKNDAPLSGEYLLGYHCQRSMLHNRPEATTVAGIQTIPSETRLEQGE